jgi:polyhydroxyalkanoate synthesis regulator phasin
MPKQSSPAEDLNEIICRIAVYGRSTQQYMEKAQQLAAAKSDEAEALRAQLERARDGECCRVAKRERDAANEKIQALTQSVATLEAMIRRSRKSKSTTE